MAVSAGHQRGGLPAAKDDAPEDGAQYQFTLFVSGASTSSARAVGDVRALCEAYLTGRYRLSVVDVNQNPELARGRRVLATPTLVKEQPGPECMLVGDLSDHRRVLAVLTAPAAGAASGDVDR